MQDSASFAPCRLEVESPEGLPRPISAPRCSRQSASDVCGRRHMRLRKELLQAFMLVRQDAGIVLEGLGHSLPVIQDDEGKHAAMILI